jgi:hypothetical protein
MTAATPPDHFCLRATGLPALRATSPGLQSMGRGLFKSTGARPMTAAEDKFITAVKALNEAAYAALRAASDTTALPTVNRHLLRGVARLSDDLVDAGLSTAKGKLP